MKRGTASAEATKLQFVMLVLNFDAWLQSAFNFDAWLQ